MMCRLLNYVLACVVVLVCMSAQASNWGHANAVDGKYSFASCHRGYQSPIDINRQYQGCLSVKRLSIKVIPGHYSAKVMNTGHDIQVVFTHEMPEVAIGKDYYHVLQFHLRTPSETTLAHRHFAGELQLVLNDTSLAPVRVLAVLLDEGRSHPGIATILQKTPHKAGVSSSAFAFTGSDLNSMLPAVRNYYQFTGSLTTPPCTNNLIWIVFMHPVSLSRHQIQMLRSFYSDNHRPTQNLRGRHIQVAQ